MKTIILSLTLLVSSSLWIEIYSQGFLKKLEKGLNKATEAVDKFLETDTQGESATTQSDASVPVASSDKPGYAGTKIKSFSKQVSIELESCLIDGKLITITYRMKNNGSGMNLISLGTGRLIINPDHVTLVSDNSGNSLPVNYLSLGDKKSVDRDALTINPYLPAQSVTKGTIEIIAARSNTTQLAVVNIAGFTKDANEQLHPFEFTFRDLPVYAVDKLYQSDKVLNRVENPLPGSRTDQDFSIKAVSFTDKSTHLEMDWKNTKYSPRAYFFINEGDAYIEANGQQYYLLACSGIGKRVGTVFVDHGSTQPFNLYFEPMPASVTSFKLFLTDKNIFENVQMQKSAGLNISKTTGIMSLKDAFNQHDKRKRITAAERTALKISSIRNPDFDTKWTNSQLAKGKQVYSGSEGSLQTLLFIENEQASEEYLISYDKQGNYVDAITIGTIRAYGGDRGEATIEGNQVKVCIEAEGISFYRLYTITPQLKFVKEKEWQEGE